MPAPPPESEPAMVSAIGNAHHVPRFASIGVDDIEQARARAAAGSGASDSAEMTATPSAPAAITSAALLGVDAGDAAHRQVRRAAVQRGDNPRQALRADRRFFCCFDSVT